MNDKFLFLSIFLFVVAICSAWYFSSPDKQLYKVEKSLTQNIKSGKVEIWKDFDMFKIFSEKKASTEIDNQDLLLKQSLNVKKDNYNQVNSRTSVQQIKRENKTVQKKVETTVYKELRFLCSHRYLCSLSNDGLEVGMGKAGAFGEAFANKYFNNGKLYFEAEIKFVSENYNNPMFHSDIGIMGKIPEGSHCSFAYPREENGCFGYGLDKILGYLKRELKAGDVVSFAVDFDNGYMYMKVNGKNVFGKKIGL